MKILQTFFGNTQIFGLGKDGKIYVWSIEKGEWLPYWKKKKGRWVFFRFGKNEKEKIGAENNEADTQTKETQKENS